MFLLYKRSHEQNAQYDVCTYLFLEKGSLKHDWGSFLKCCCFRQASLVRHFEMQMKNMNGSLSAN